MITRREAIEKEDEHREQAESILSQSWSTPAGAAAKAARANAHATLALYYQRGSRSLSV